MSNQIVLELNPSETNLRHSEGAFVTLKDGRILFAWSKYTDSNDDDAASFIACRYSSDGGVTWTPEDEVLLEPDAGAHNLMSVSLLRLQDGRILFLYMQKEEAGAGIIHCTPYVRYSDDEMQTLSEPQAITLAPDYYSVNNDRVIQLESGRIVVPMAVHRYTSPKSVVSGLPMRPQLALSCVIYFLLSDDGGQTWYESLNSYYRNFPDGNGLQESGVIALQGDRLWSWARTAWKNGEAHPRQWQSFSEDAGRVWSEPEPSDFVTPCSPLSMKRIPGSGHLLAVWNDHSGRFPLPAIDPSVTINNYWSQERRPLVTAISRDEGLTWEHHRVLEDTADHSYCYVSIHFVEDHVLLAYCAGGPLPQTTLDRLRLRRLSLDELYEG